MLTRVDRVQPNDPLPDALLDFLQALPCDDQPHVGSAPPKKRARVDAVNTVIVARKSFMLSRPRRRSMLATPRDEPILRRDVGRYLKLQYDEKNRWLTVSSKPKSPYGAFRSELFLGRPQFTEPVLVALRVMSHSRDPEDCDGALWAAIDITFERKDDMDRMRFSLAVKWNTSTNTLRNTSQRALSQQVLDTFLERSVLGRDEANEVLSPQAFYEAAFMPESKGTGPRSLTVPGLTTKLYPFQHRALQWLLTREGVSWEEGCSHGEAGLVAHSERPPHEPLSFSLAKDADGNPVYVSDLYHVVLKDISPIRERENTLRGGILAEEMGLGKTVETISLILMHKRPCTPSTVFDHYTAQNVRPSSATLIVTPATLRKQWVSEFTKHAPNLRVMVYDGMKRFKGDDDDLVTEMAGHDVVITTYNVLQAEIHFAEPPPERSMRQERRYQRPKSPLVQLSWWRVCLDEAQQIESGVSHAAKVARLIPRINAWGITGTPVKENIKDLWGLLLFLRYEPFASSFSIWEGLTTTHKALFKPLFNHISLRHTKRAVRAELELPPQKRYVVTMPFTAIEEQHFQTQFKTLARGFGLDASGLPLQQDWDPEDPYIVDLMKRALAQLRQTVLHPELGPGRLRTLGQKNKPLRTIEEVLDAMIEQSESAIRTDQRTYLTTKLKRGQLLENSPRVREALAIWAEARKEIEALVRECREQLRVEVESARQAGIEETMEEIDSHHSENSDDPDRAVFFIASAYFQIKSNEDMTEPGSEDFKRLEKLEIEGYELAKQIRKEILQEAHSKAAFYMTRVQEDAATQSFVEIPEIESSPLHGIESRETLRSLELLGGVLNGQANLIDEWRENVIQILLRPLVDEEGEAEVTGEEYEDSTKIQDELMVYTLVLRAAIADRQDALSGLENERVKYDTRYAERQAKDGEGPAPEKVLELLQQRQESKPAREDGSFRGIVSGLRELATKLRHDAADGSDRARVELEIVQKQLNLIQHQVAEQNKAAAALERELDRFTSAMNARIEYYRQLQAVSDTVAVREQEENEDTDSIMKNLLNEEQSAQRRFTAAQSKHRYLHHLKEAGRTSNEPKICVICQSDFTVGVLTVCGHQFCKDCMRLWFKAHHNCPVCKKHLTLAMLHDITLKRQDLRVREEEHNSSRESDSPQKTKSTSIYSQFSDDKLEAIKNIKLDGPSFATKIDTLIKHLLWLREEDPGAKSIVFSQFREFLDVLSRAFDRYRIGFTSFDRKDGISKFKEDPGIECFLMDARAHASGLNLVNASHVFLCEPLLNTALELQAIARVDRIGQEHETTVWLYVVEATVEESIYDLSVKRRLEHIDRSNKGKSKESTPEISDLNLEAANSMELQQAALSKMMNKDRQLGEVVDKNDLWECLFGHVRKEDGVSEGHDERFKDPRVMGFLAGEAAKERSEAQANQVQDSDTPALSH
ncbi:hypothetical protein DL764_008905 [Monosporascus ibericus]|uniref:RING-type domain-containing protein n=1 Tax=Monosporascus ibericus TaxID=155417 RepID=A0A4Q4SW97_9PEZI|nr:hypothetical protein DL764_008905 [Monosporascus ibericus]